MSLVALFVVGFAVTLIVGAAVGLLLYAAVLDGRRQRELTRTEAVRVSALNAQFRDPVTDSGPEPLGAA